MAGGVRVKTGGTFKREGERKNLFFFFIIIIIFMLTRTLGFHKIAAKQKIDKLPTNSITFIQPRYHSALFLFRHVPYYLCVFFFFRSYSSFLFLSSNSFLVLSFSPRSFFSLRLFPYSLCSF